MNLTAIDQAAGIAGADATDKRLLLPNGKMQLLPAAEIDAVDPNDLAYFCWRTGRYGLVTRELITLLHGLVRRRRAIEIGAGNGDLGYHLGIPMFDSKLQEQADVADFYALTKQPTIKYPADVLKLEGLAAVKRITPQVVVASWVTQWIDPALPPPPGGGSIYGVREDKILNLGASYIHIGNARVHELKQIRRRAHVGFTIPGLRSRSPKEDDNVFIWGEAANWVSEHYDANSEILSLEVPDSPATPGSLPQP